MSSVFHDLVKKKLAAMRGKFPPIHSPHEGLALVWEEFRELRKDVMKRKRKGDPLRLLNELVDLAAICEMFAEDQCGRERTD